ITWCISPLFPMCPFSLHIRLLSSSTLFPYTTLFRSVVAAIKDVSRKAIRTYRQVPRAIAQLNVPEITVLKTFAPLEQRSYFCGRSEEHTSELQSRENLVCRLLLEKKKIKKKSENIIN